MLASAPMPTPMKFSRRNIVENGEHFANTTAYRRLIGKLIYLTNTHPDISNVVHQLSQHVAAPTTVHHQACFRVLRYLKQNHGHGIFLDANNEIRVKGFNDSDWAGCPKTRKSIIGFIIYLGHSSLLGNQRNKAQFLGAQLKLNTRLLPPPHMRYNGYYIFSRIFKFSILNLPSYFVTTNQPCRLPLTKSSTREQNILKMIATLLEKRFKTTSSNFSLLNPKINMWIF